MNSEFKHFGIPGMRWGVRKDRDEAVSKMSDEDLKKAINRANLERQYKDISKAEKNEAVEFVTGIIKESAKNTATKYVSQAMTYGVEIVLAAIKVRKK